MTAQETITPVLGYRIFTPLYDPVLRFTLREGTFKSSLIRKAEIQSGYSVLDLGSGTGTLSIMLKNAHPDVEVTGLDADPQVIEIARRKAKKARVGIDFRHGLANELPFPDDHFDRILSSLLFHHLTVEQKSGAFAECLRVLRPGGRLHVADWGRPAGRLMRAAFYSIQILDGFETTRDNAQGRLPALMEDAGFTDVRASDTFNTIYGTLALYQAVKAGP